MVILRTILIFIVLTFSVFAKPQKILDVQVDCSGRGACSQVEKKFMALKGKAVSKNELYRKIEFELNNAIYRKLYFKLEKGVLKVTVALRQKVTDITFDGDDEFLLRRLIEEIPVKEGSYFNKKDLDEALIGIREKYFSSNKDLIRYKTIDVPDGIELRVIFSNKGLKKLSEINIIGVNDSLKKQVIPFVEELKNNTWESISFRRKMEEVEQFIDELGYWNSKVTYDVKHNDDSVDIDIKIALGLRFAFTFQGINYFDHYRLTSEMKKLVKNQSVKLTEDLIIQRISELYKDRGVFYTDVSVRKARGVDKVSRYEVNFVTITEGRKVDLAEVVFSGNRELTTDDLEEIYSDNASTLLSRGFLDIKSLEYVTAKLREFYISKGFIFSSIEDPIIIFGEDGNEAFVTFKITESSKYSVNKVNISGVEDQEIVKDLQQILKNEEGKDFDVTKVDEDLKTALEFVKNKGYFFTTYAEKNPKKIIKVSNSSKSIDINLSFKTGKKSFLGDIIVTGNLETNETVIKRELKAKKGELITPEKMNKFVNRLRSLGLFANVNITPFIGNNIGKKSSFLNFIVKVKEKNFGKAEVAPGFRTDLGYKISSTVSFNNISGMNRSLVAKLQTNLRTSYSYLDDRRRAEEQDKLEWLGQVKFIEPYLFGLELEWDFGVKYQRKRYSGFDADILSISPSLTKEFTDAISASVEYEYDVIRQFDATLEEDGDRFKIGAITPSVTFDYRDNSTAPTKGAWFNFSWEFANPYFASQNDPDLTINYNRAVSRNYFYYPLTRTKKLVLASSITLGIEKNFARDPLFDDNGNAILDSDGKQKTQGFIPSLKVFRLSGRDLLRGYSDDESNVLYDGTDISDVIVRDTAYLVNFKLEPRYYLSDNSVFAFFLDAGRVYNKSVRFFDLKTSAGFSFKLLTPVGSLDFDYGVKLHRERNDSGSRESFGRFHVSIGQF